MDFTNYIKQMTTLTILSDYLTTLAQVLEILNAVLKSTEFEQELVFKLKYNKSHLIINNLNLIIK